MGGILAANRRCWAASPQSTSTLTRGRFGCGISSRLAEVYRSRVGRPAPVPRGNKRIAQPPGVGALSLPATALLP
ncbi:hypothetical protein BN381_290110 [Candidatus Microthrix parvicella RN1]|uniref:Uncharacterized protein n=1 Tax=Candidatus Neomicrothrix parvicella RN1 TaxID=1229780 RepID=R4Z5A5_9ACTN|nr:hypothetical protein BN381_290110 [Candidatus Microthrix parvicella RN1]